MAVENYPALSDYKPPLVFTLKLESGSKITIFGLKMMVKSGLEKFVLNKWRMWEDGYFCY